MQVGFLVRSTVALTERWTTVHWMSAALALGHRVWVFENQDVAVSERRWTTRGFALEGPATPEEVVYSLTRRTAPRRRIRLTGLDVVLLRSAPLDLAVLGVGAALVAAGVRVVNAPLGQLTVAHKSWLAAQDLPIPTTLVTTSRGEAVVFHEQHGTIVVKADRGSGGSTVFRVEADDHDGLREAFRSARGQRGRVVLQPCLEGSAGEQRLLWCDGEVVGGYLRRSAEQDFRHNLRQGGTAEGLTMGDDARVFGPLLQPLLAPLGIRFAGLDVLDGRLLEVNAVNPGGTVYADALNGTRLGRSIVERLLEAPGPGNNR